MQQAMEKMLFNIMNTPIHTYPFPHFVTQDVFPDGFHDEMVKNLPPREAYRGLSETGQIMGYDEETRFVLELKTDMDRMEGKTRDFWNSVNTFITGERFVNAMIQKFGAFIAHRFKEEGQKKIGFKLDLFRDFTGYELGPHTDAGTRLLNIFFYLPKDNDHPHMGTSFYVPKDPGFICKGGPHHDFDQFTNVYTVPCYKNVAAGFFRNDKSFHGVEPVAEKGYERNALALMLYAV